MTTIQAAFVGYLVALPVIGVVRGWREGPVRSAVAWLVFGVSAPVLAVAFAAICFKIWQALGATP